MARVMKQEKVTRAIQDSRPGATVARAGAPFNNAQAKKIAPVLRRIEQDKKVLRPEDVVTEARNPSSPLHDFFEWDDSKAAHQHRLSVARTIIKVVHYRVQLEGPSSTLMRDSIPAFISVQTVDKNGKKDKFYASHHSPVISRQEHRRLQIERAIDQLNSWKRTFNVLLALSKGADGIVDTLLERLVQLR